MTQIRARITNRTEPCTCGCNGRDPWHAKYFIRTISVTSEGWEKSHDSFEGGVEYGTLARGTAKFPWGEDNVVLSAIKSKDNNDTVSYGWKRVN